MSSTTTTCFVDLVQHPPLPAEPRAVDAGKLLAVRLAGVRIVVRSMRAATACRGRWLHHDRRRRGWSAEVERAAHAARRAGALLDSALESAWTTCEPCSNGAGGRSAARRG